MSAVVTHSKVMDFSEEGKVALGNGETYLLSGQMMINEIETYMHVFIFYCSSVKCSKPVML